MSSRFSDYKINPIIHIPQKPPEKWPERNEIPELGGQAVRAGRKFGAEYFEPNICVEVAIETVPDVIQGSLIKVGAMSWVLKCPY